MKKIVFYICLLSVGTLSLQSCDKYLDIQPVGTVVPKTIEDFRGLMTSGYQGFPSHKSYLTLRTDEVLLDEYSTDVASVKDIYLWKDANPDPNTISMPYVGFYKSIFYANHIIANIDTEVGSTTEAKQVKAEAYLMRAYAHFELLNLYADNYSTANAGKRGVPLSLKVDLEQVFVPATIEQSYAQVMADMKEAASLMQVVDQDAKVKYRFSKRVLHAFEARVHLYRSEWQEALAAAEAALAINGDLEDLNVTSALLPSDFQSKEMILSLEKVAIPSVKNSTYISTSLLNSYNKDNDMRFVRYFQKRGGDYISLKGGDNKYNVSFRNADLYLIVAEAYAQLGNTDKAVEKLGVLLQKRLKPTYYTQQMSALSKEGATQLLVSIAAERNRELALEGQRWYDLKRSTRPEITHSFVGTDYVLRANDPRYVIRYPQVAIDNNPELGF